MTQSKDRPNEIGKEVSKEVKKQAIIKRKKRNILRSKFIPYLFVFITLVSIIVILGLLAKQLLAKNAADDGYSIQNDRS
jgi:hypothetical protein